MVVYLVATTAPFLSRGVAGPARPARPAGARGLVAFAKYRLNRLANWMGTESARVGRPGQQGPPSWRRREGTDRSGLMVQGAHA